MSLKLPPRDTTRRILPRAAAVALALGGLTSSIVVAGSAGATPSRKGVVISTTTNPKYGTILVSGTTVYTLKAAGKVSCGAKCLKVWPQVLLPKGMRQAKAGSDVDATKLGTVKRRGGVLQVTYAGKGLYWFYDDHGPNQVKGAVKDKWGSWSVVVMSSAASGSLQPAAGTTTVPSTTPTNRTAPANGSTPTTGMTTPGSGTTAPGGTAPTSPPTTPTTSPPATTTVPTTTTTTPPTTTTTSGGGGGGGIGF